MKKYSFLFFMVVLPFVFLRFLSLPIFSENHFDITASVNWMTGSLHVQFISPIEDSKKKTFRKTQTVQQTFLKRKTLFLTRVLQNISFDSEKTVGDFWLNSPEQYTLFSLNTTTKEENFQIQFKDNNVAHVSFNINIYKDVLPFLKELPPSYHPDPLPTYLSYIPSFSFTGLVIYARDSLKTINYEGNPESYLKPTFFPKIYMEDGTTLLKPSLLKPSFLYKWGTSGYSYSSSLRDLSERIGFQPLRTYALALRGKNKTDLVIPSKAGRQMLSNPNNRRLLQEGRVIIILPEVKMIIHPLSLDSQNSQ